MTALNYYKYNFVGKTTENATMPTLHKAKEIAIISLKRIRSYTIENSIDLVFVIGNMLDRDLVSSCRVKSISHYQEIKATIKNKISHVALEKEELPGKTLERKNEPQELKFFSYSQLKKSAKLNNNVYRGKLYGTIELHSCNSIIDCPVCEGTGICCNCSGNKQIICPICDGQKDCVSCDGTGRYHCENCGGDGICPECDDGWIFCDDCDGSGDYKAACNRCGGSGWYDRDKDKVCYVCKGSGEFVTTCHNCDGDGGRDCHICHGTGKCAHCHGHGDVKCKACKGVGKCGKCKGHGMIWCPTCQGKGKCFDCKGEKQIICPRCKGEGCFQSFSAYTLSEESQTTKELCTFPIDQEHINSITGDICYNGVIYDFFAQKAIVFDVDSALQSLDGIRVQNVKEWIAIENNSTFEQNKINDDYLNTYLELYKVPVTKLVLVCNSKDYTIWIVGNNRIVFYDDLPSSFARLCGKIGKWFE